MPKLIASIRDYLHTTKWLLTDSLFRFRKKALLIITVQTIGTFMQASAIALILQYINLLERGATFTVWRFTLDPEAISFVYVALGVLLFFVIAAGLLLVSRLKMLDIGFDYSKFCSQRVFGIYFRNRFNPRFNKRYEKSKIASLAGGISLRCGRVLRMSLMTVRPAVISLIAAAALLFINPFLTSIIGGLALATLIFQYRISRDVARYSVLREEYSPQESSAKKKILGDTPKFPSTMDSSVFDRNVAGKSREESASYYESFKGWLAGGPKSDFVSNVLMAVGLCLVLVVLIGDVLRTGEGWAGVIAYVVALQFAFTNLRALATSITGINRFYPQVLRYKRYVAEFSQPQDGVRRSGKLIHLDSDSVYSLVMQKGLTLDAFFRKLNLSPESGIAYIGADFPFADISFAESLGLSDLSREDYWDVIRNTDMAELFQKNATDLINIEKPDSWGRVDPRLVFLMMLVTFIRSQAAYALVKVDDVKSISRPTWDYILSLKQGKTIIINHNHSLDGIGDCGEKAVILLHDKTFDILTVDQFNSSKASIKEQLKAPAVSKEGVSPDAEARELEATEGESTGDEGF